MRELFSFCFELLTDPLSLPLDPITEFVILIVLNWLAYKVAFRTVGDMYDGGIISGGAVGSFFHWVLRLSIFVVVWATTNGVIFVGRFVAQHWLIILYAGLLSVFTIWLIHYCALKLQEEKRQ